RTGGASAARPGWRCRSWSSLPVDPEERTTRGGDAAPGPAPMIGHRDGPRNPPGSASPAIVRGEGRGDGLSPVINGALPLRRAPPRARAGAVAPRPGSDVSTTQMVPVAGSAQQSVPVEPLWPNVRAEHPRLPDSSPTANPNPRGVNPAGL